VAHLSRGDRWGRDSFAVQAQRMRDDSGQELFDNGLPGAPDLQGRRESRGFHHSRPASQLVQRIGSKESTSTRQPDVFSSRRSPRSFPGTKPKIARPCATTPRPMDAIPLLDARRPVRTDHECARGLTSMQARRTETEMRKADHKC
jgi:hypothetical protein